MRSIIVLSAVLSFLLPQASAQAQQFCDGSIITATGEIEDVTYVQKNNEYYIDTTSSVCCEISIEGQGRPPRKCVNGAIVAATGLVEGTLVGLTLVNVTEIVCN